MPSGHMLIIDFMRGAWKTMLKYCLPEYAKRGNENARVDPKSTDAEWLKWDNLSLQIAGKLLSLCCELAVPECLSLLKSEKQSAEARSDFHGDVDDDMEAASFEDEDVLIDLAAAVQGYAARQEIV